MRMVLIALIGLVLGFFCGEAIATLAGIISFAVFSSSTPSGPVLWMLRGLPFVCALACAIVVVNVYLRRRPG